LRLQHPFYRLPLVFDAARLGAEVAAVGGDAWMPHPTHFRGNSAAILISVDGEPNDDFAIAGPMRPTPLLADCPYVRQVLASFRAPISRTRLMRVAGREQVPKHRDNNYHWHRRVRIHIPIATQPAVRFECGSATRHMAAGEAWIFDTTRPHSVRNPTPEPRVHLVADSKGSPAFWRLVEAAQRGGNPMPGSADLVDYRPELDGMPEIEPYRFERSCRRQPCRGSTKTSTCSWRGGGRCFSGTVTHPLADPSTASSSRGSGGFAGPSDDACRQMLRTPRASSRRCSCGRIAVAPQWAETRQVARARTS